MAPRRAYSDSAVNGVLGNILYAINGSPEEALQKAQLAQAVLGIDKGRGELDARDAIANMFAMNPAAADVQGGAGSLVGNGVRAGIGGQDLGSLALAYSALAGHDNAANARGYVASGHAIQPNDAFTPERQDELARTQERVGDERLSSQLANQFSIAQMNETGQNNRFYHNPVSVPGGGMVRRYDENGNPEDIMGPAKVPGAGEGRQPLDVAPSDVLGKTGLGKMIDKFTGDAPLDEQTKMKVVHRAAAIYQQTRDSAGAVQQAIDELTQVTDDTTMLGRTLGYTPHRTLKDGAAPVAPAATQPAPVQSPTGGASPVDDLVGSFYAQPPTDQNDPVRAAEQPPVVAAPSAATKFAPGQEPDGTIQRSKKDPTKFRIKENGQWREYKPNQ